MEAFLLKLLNMSLTGSYVILFVLLVRLCLRRAPRAVSYALWAVPFLRLAVPFSFESAFSLVRVKPEAIPQDIAYAAVPAIDSGVRPLDTVVNAALTAAAPPVDTAASVNPMQVLLFVGFWLWLAGVLVLVGSSLFQTVRLCGYLRTARPVEGNVYEIGRADTPFVFGFLRPRIYLPAGLEDAERAYILAHERHHVARRDPILRALAFAVTAAHWFNPLVWVAYWLMGVDMELSCDEAVLRRAPADIRKAYSSSLVALSTLPRALRPGPLGFSEGGVRSRVKNALRYRRPARWLTVLAVCACLLAACGLLSSPDSGDDPAVSPAASGEASGALSFAEECAYNYMMEAEQMLAKHIEIANRGFGILEMGTFEGMLDEPVTVYNVEVFYNPADYEAAVEALSHTAIEPDFVKNGDQYEIRNLYDFSVVYLAIKGGDTLVAQYYDESASTGRGAVEASLRRELEANGLLTGPTYDSDHYVVVYELSHPGFYDQLLLSRPVANVNGGIWCVERYMDGDSGNVYLNTPDTETSAQEYYDSLQAECDAGHRAGLLDPEQVALEFIRRDYQNARIISMKEADYDEFLVPPVGAFTGHIFEIDEEGLRVTPTVLRDGAEGIWATGYPAYYDYFRTEVWSEDYFTLEGGIKWTLNGEPATLADFRAAVEAASPDASGLPGLHATITCSCGVVLSVSADT